MNDRRAQLLKMVIEQYIHTAQPIGSKALAEEGELDVSGATIRNELRALEEDGYLTHPHTSAGRIPTEAGYRYYVDNLMDLSASGHIKKTVQKNVKEILDEHIEHQVRMKGVAKKMAAWTQNATLVIFGSDSIYYTGISYLFSQPEFRDYAHTVRMSEIFDECERHVDSFEESVGPEETQIFIGKENPLGSACSSIVWRPQKNLLFAVVGPMRMDYKKTSALFSSLQDIL